MRWSIAGTYQKPAKSPPSMGINYTTNNKAKLCRKLQNHSEMCREPAVECGLWERLLHHQILVLLKR